MLVPERSRPAAGTNQLGFHFQDFLDLKNFPLRWFSHLMPSTVPLYIHWKSPQPRQLYHNLQEQEEKVVAWMSKGLQVKAGCTVIWVICQLCWIFELEVISFLLPWGSFKSETNNSPLIACRSKSKRLPEPHSVQVWKRTMKRSTSPDIYVKCSKISQSLFKAFQQISAASLLPAHIWNKNWKLKVPKKATGVRSRQTFGDPQRRLRLKPLKNASKVKMVSTDSRNVYIVQYI